MKITKETILIWLVGIALGISIGNSVNIFTNAKNLNREFKKVYELIDLINCNK